MISTLIQMIRMVIQYSDHKFANDSVRLQLDPDDPDRSEDFYGMHCTWAESAVSGAVSADRYDLRKASGSAGHPDQTAEVAAIAPEILIRMIDGYPDHPDHVSGTYAIYPNRASRYAVRQYPFGHRDTQCVKEVRR